MSDPTPPLPLPQEGGAWVRLPDGSLQRQAEPEQEAAPGGDEEQAP